MKLKTIQTDPPIIVAVVGADDPRPPSKVAMVRNIAAAALSAAKNPTMVSGQEKARRLEICGACEFLIRQQGKSDRCAKCGCFLRWKTALESWHCPIKKW